MRSMFRMGFQPAPFFLGHSLGQQTLEPADQSKLFDDLVDTEGKQDIIAQWKKNHPNVDTDMGADAVRFKSLETAAAAQETIAKDVMKRAGGVDPAQVTLAELTQTKDWMNNIHQMYLLVAAHTGKAQLPAAAPAAEAAPAINPIALGIGAAGLLILMVVAIK